MGCWSEKDGKDDTHADEDVFSTAVTVSLQQEEGYESSKSKLVPSVVDSYRHDIDLTMAARDFSPEKRTYSDIITTTAYTVLVDQGYCSGQHRLEKSSTDSEPLSTTHDCLLPQKPRQCTSEVSLSPRSSGFICDNCGKMCASLVVGMFDWEQSQLQMQQCLQTVDQKFIRGTSIRTYCLSDHEWQDVSSETSVVLLQPQQPCHRKQVDQSHGEWQSTASNTEEEITETTASYPQTFLPCTQETEPHLPEDKVEFVIQTPCLPAPLPFSHYPTEKSRPSLKVMHTYPRPFVCNMSVYVGEEHCYL